MKREIHPGIALLILLAICCFIADLFWRSQPPYVPPVEPTYSYGYSYGQINSVYPNPKLTPGKIATSDLKALTEKTPCGTYSECHRNTSQKLKDTVCHEYYTSCKGMEIDHLVPLALGGADEQANLWPQQGEGQWNFRDKDKLETYLVAQVKAGKIPVKTAQNCIAADWIACYKHYLSNPQFGAVEPVTDGEDDIY